MMKKASFVILISVILFILTQTAMIVFAAEPVALVSDIKGSGTIKHIGSKTVVKLEILSELFSGDVISLKKGSQVKITFYKDTHAELIKGDYEGSVLPDKMKMLKGTAASSTQLASYSGVKTLKSIEASSEKFGGSAARTWKQFGISFYTPRRTIADTTPNFLFGLKKSDPSNQLRILLVEESTGNIVFEDSCDSGSMKYPSNAKPLEYGKIYKWNVIAYKNGERYKLSVPEEEMQPFKVADREVCEKLQILKKQVDENLRANPDDLSHYVVLLSFCLENNLLEESYNTCSILLKKRPDDENIKKLYTRLCQLRDMQEGL